MEMDMRYDDNVDAVLVLASQQDRSPNLSSRYFFRSLLDLELLHDDAVPTLMVNQYGTIGFHDLHDLPATSATSIIYTTGAAAN